MFSSAEARTVLIAASTGAVAKAPSASPLPWDSNGTALVHTIHVRSQALADQEVEAVEDRLNLYALRPGLDGTDAPYFAYPMRPGLIHATLNFVKTAEEISVSTVMTVSRGMRSAGPSQGNVVAGCVPGIDRGWPQADAELPGLLQGGAPAEQLLG